MSRELLSSWLMVVIRTRFLDDSASGLFLYVFVPAIVDVGG